MQEVRLCAIAQQIPELASMGWSFAPNFIDTFRNTYSGVLTATKGDRLYSKAKITQHQEPLTRTPKVSLFVEYSLGKEGETFLTVNTHYESLCEISGKFKICLEQLSRAYTDLQYYPKPRNCFQSEC